MLPFAGAPMVNEVRPQKWLSDFGGAFQIALFRGYFTSLRLYRTHFRS